MGGKSSPEWGSDGTDSSTLEKESNFLQTCREKGGGKKPVHKVSLAKQGKFAVEGKQKTFKPSSLERRGGLRLVRKNCLKGIN